MNDSEKKDMKIFVRWCLGVVISFWVGFHIAVKLLQRDAVNNNVAEWKVDKHGNTTFCWKTQFSRN